LLIKLQVYWQNLALLAKCHFLALLAKYGGTLFSLSLIVKEIMRTQKTALKHPFCGTLKL